MEDFFLILAVIFAVAMLILMIKYAKFIHSQPRIDAERRKIKEEEFSSNKNKSNDN